MSATFFSSKTFEKTVDKSIRLLYNNNRKRNVAHLIRKRGITMNDGHTWDLSAKFDRAKSFYGKAVVKEDADKLTLYSYKSKVCEINKRTCKSSDDDARDCVTIFTPYRYDSVTTVRHIKEFLKQYGFKAETKNQIFSDYKLA